MTSGLQFHSPSTHVLHQYIPVDIFINISIFTGNWRKWEGEGL